MSQKFKLKLIFLTDNTKCLQQRCTWIIHNNKRFELVSSKSGNSRILHFPSKCPSHDGKLPATKIQSNWENAESWFTHLYLYSCHVSFCLFWIILDDEIEGNVDILDEFPMLVRVFSIGNLFLDNSQRQNLLDCQRMIKHWHSNVILSSNFCQYSKESFVELIF